MNEVNNIPEGWRETTLGEVSKKKQYGYTESASLDKIGPKFLRITDIQNDFINWETVPYCPINQLDNEKYKLLVGDIVVARTGNSTGATATIKEEVDAVFASYLIRFQLDNEVADYNFIDFLLRSRYWAGFVNSVKSGSAQGGANANDFATFKISLPKLPEQKSIAAILTAFDNKIELLQAQNKTLEETAQTIFKEWFGKYQIGDELPEGWREGKLGEVVKTTSGSTPSREIETYYINGIYNWVKSKELNGSFIIDTEEKITEIAFEKSSVKLFPAYSVLIAMYGNTVGEYAIVSKPMTCNQAVCALIPNEKIPYTYLFFLIKSLKPEFINNSVGSAQQNISQILIKNTDLVYSELVIAKFHKKAQPLLEKILVNTEQIQTLTQTRDALLPKLMSGEIRVKM